jgi:hypothetical protein
MKNQKILVITAVIVLFVSGLAFAHMMGTGHSCCAMHHVQ